MDWIQIRYTQPENKPRNGDFGPCSFLKIFVSFPCVHYSKSADLNHWYEGWFWLHLGQSWKKWMKMHQNALLNPTSVLFPLGAYLHMTDKYFFTDFSVFFSKFVFKVFQKETLLEYPSKSRYVLCVGNMCTW